MTLPRLRAQQVDGERVGDHHDGERHVEGGQRARDEEVGVEDAALVVAAQDVLGPQHAQHDDGTGGEQRDHPHRRHLERHAAARPGARTQRVAHADVAVQRDDAHVHDGGRTHHDVSDLPQRTHR